MQRLYKFGLAAGLISILGYGGCRINSKIDKVRKEQSQIEERINRELLHINQRLDQTEEAVYRQLTLIGILEEYDVNRNKIIDNDEYERYSRDVLKIKRILKEYDTDSSGLLNREELYRLLKDYMSKNGISGRTSIEKVLKYVLKKYDKDRDGLLNKVEMIKLIHDYEKAFLISF